MKLWTRDGRSTGKGSFLSAPPQVAGYARPDRHHGHTMVPRTWLALAILLIANCHPAPPALSQPPSSSAPPSRDSLIASVCSPTEGQPSCTRRIERRYLVQAGTRADRRGDGLILNLQNGTTAIYRDSVGEGPTDVVFGYRGYIASIGYFLLDMQFYEGGGYLLVNARTGHATASDGPPLVSPSHDYVAAGNVDLESQFTPTTLTIWRVTPDSLALAWRHEFVQDGIITDSTFGPSDLRWVSRTELRFRKEFRSGLKGGEGSVRLAASGWHLGQP
jgi:hypothetical protein